MRTKIIYLRFYYYHWVDITAGGLLVPKGIVCPVVVLLSLGRYHCWWTISSQGYRLPSSGVTITGSISLLVDYQFPRVSSVQQSVLLSLGRYHCWWTISSQGYRLPSSQCYYHQVDITADGLLVPKGIVCPVVSVTITGSISLLVDYQFPRVSSAQQSVLLSLGRYHCWWTISFRGYRLPSSQCYYHQVDISAGGLLVPEGIVCPVVSVTITRSISLLVDYQFPRVSFSQQSVLLSLGRYLCWWTISSQGYRLPSSQCYYHYVDISAGGLLVPEGIVCPVVSVTITRSISLLMDYQFPRVSSVQQSVLLSLGRYHCWWTISSQGYRLSSSQCYYHQVDITAGGLLVPKGIVCPVVGVTITRSISLLVDYQFPRVSSVQQSVLLSLGRYHCWWTISSQGYRLPSSQCYYHQVDITAGGLLVPEGIVCPVVSVTITRSISLLVDYQFPRASFAQQSVLLSLGRYHCWWTISSRGYRLPSSQCYYHQVDITAGGLLVPMGIVCPVVSVTITGSISLLVDYQFPRVSFAQQSVLLSLGRYHW